jgi:dihydrofolate synthase/folylpolyglutamate synthase
VAIIEVGLGGRFDSTNVVRPRLSIITEISYDHMAQLGNTLEKIAFEKAGIIKMRVPVVCSALASEARAVFEKVAKERQSRLTLIDRDFALSVEYPLSLIGEHQKMNASGVLAAVRELVKQGLKIPERAIERGLATTYWPARIEKLGDRPLNILDCAHNGASAKVLIETLRAKYPVIGSKHLIVALSSDKQVEEILKIWADYFDVFHCTRYANNPRGTPPEQIANLLKERKPTAPIHIYPTSVAALAAAKATCGTEDLLVISGSVFLAGDLRPHLIPQMLNQEKSL